MKTKLSLLLTALVAGSVFAAEQPSGKVIQRFAAALVDAMGPDAATALAQCSPERFDITKAGGLSLWCIDRDGRATKTGWIPLSILRKNDFGIGKDSSGANQLYDTDALNHALPEERPDQQRYRAELDLKLIRDAAEVIRGSDYQRQLEAERANSEEEKAKKDLDLIQAQLSKLPTQAGSATSHPQESQDRRLAQALLDSITVEDFASMFPPRQNERWVQDDDPNFDYKLDPSGMAVWRWKRLDNGGERIGKGWVSGDALAKNGFRICRNSKNDFVLVDVLRFQRYIPNEDSTRRLYRSVLGSRGSGLDLHLNILEAYGKTSAYQNRREAAEARDKVWKAQEDAQAQKNLEAIRGSLEKQ